MSISAGTGIGCGNGTYSYDIISYLQVEQSSAGSKGRQVVTFTPTAEQLTYGNKLAIRFIRTNQADKRLVSNISNIQLVIGMNSNYNPYITPQTATASSDGTVSGLTSISPNMTLLSNNSGAVIDLNYNQDTNAVITKLTNAIIALGGNV